VEQAKLREISFEFSLDFFMLCKNPKIQKSKNPKIQKIHFSKTFLRKSKMDIKKVCPKFKLAKKFPKKKNFFLSSQTEKLFSGFESVF